MWTYLGPKVNTCGTSWETCLECSSADCPCQSISVIITEKLKEELVPV